MTWITAKCYLGTQINYTHFSVNNFCNLVAPNYRTYFYVPYPLNFMCVGLRLGNAKYLYK